MYLEYDVLITVAESRPEWVCRVGGGCSVEDHGPLSGVEQVGHTLPLTVWGDVDRTGGGPLHVTTL